MMKKQEIQLFNDRRIRTVWDDKEEKWYFSVVDVIEALTDSPDPSTYWRVLKNRLKKEGNETVTICNAFKLPARDGKMRLTPIADQEQLFRLIQSIPSPEAEHIKSWIEGLNRSEQQEKSLSVVTQDVQDKVVSIRGHHVITDADVAELYGVDTKRVNEAVKNNPDKFPKDYMFAVTDEEMQDLRSKFSTTKISTKSRVAVKVFTEKGLYMLATILKSRRAQDVTFAIIETFAKVRYLKREVVDLHKETDAEKQTTKMQKFGEVISDIVMPDLETSETESTLELNFFIGKIKHTVKRVKKNK